MNRKHIALTFDDGPAGTMGEIMDLLEPYQAKATFFVVGSRINEKTAELLKRAVRNGHEIGNHSQSHLHMTAMGAEEVNREVEPLQMLVKSITGAAPRLFRPPYLDVDDALLASVAMPFIGGTGNRDWEPACSVQQRISLALDAVGDGAVLLMHCFERNDATVEALRSILPELKRQGYEMVTVSRLFEEKGVVPQNGVLYHKL